MEIVSSCLLISAALSIQPDRSQFFRYESFSLSCAVKESFEGWMVRRRTSESEEPCEDWGRRNGSSCINRSVYQSDTGTYWCQSGSECSNVLKIQINTGHVILEVPASDVIEGERVTLRCSYKERYEPKSSSDFPAKFYRNGSFIGEEPDGTMDLQEVSLSDKGFYHCEHPTGGESLKSWLNVTERAEGPDLTPPPPLALVSLNYLVITVLLFILFTIIFIVCISIYCRWARGRDKRRQPL